MDRISIKTLEGLCETINKVTGSPDRPWTRAADGKLHANIGNYHISQQYGGVCLHRMVNDGGGVTTPLSYGHIPKRELWEQMRAYLRGLTERTAA